ncbi:MAG: type I-U CRISPR-associated RAMP protein Csb1/Cas7u [Bryobacteraceae bacterium]
MNGDVTALRAVTRLAPVGGTGDKVFPPTYEGGKYAEEERHLGEEKPLHCVLLDSVQSQANRMELALLEARRAGRIPLPLIEVAIEGHGVITSLDAPHRVHDAIFRDSLWDGVAFRKSANGARLVSARPQTATAFFEFCPTALLFGTWDSQGGGGAASAKVPRAITSEIVAIDAEKGRRTASRIDPLGIKAMAGLIVEAKKAEDQWDLKEDGSKAKLFGKKGKPSEINHGNVTPTITDGGVTMREGKQTTVLSLTQLRRLRFPDAGGNSSGERDRAAQTVIALLGICAFLGAHQEGLDLRARCHLAATAEPKFEVIRRVLAPEPESFAVTLAQAEEALRAAVSDATKQGLRWVETVTLKPTPKLVQLVQKSDASTAGEDEAV